MFYFCPMNARFFTPPIPNGWFQVAYSDEIKPGDVKSLKYFGDDLVVWRSEDGELSVRARRSRTPSTSRAKPGCRSGGPKRSRTW
ncbi:MAG: Rieske 2Fe-2S domain-containing protein [Deltaproteobacteria bacterium]|nr:Rieske 2Fe-2S domain-containing protein [Deltaproteobacteria bacterium]